MNRGAMTPATIYADAGRPEWKAAGRQWQGIPAIERTGRGRLFACWYSGGKTEEPGNIIVVEKSDDDGKTWSDGFYTVAHDDGEVRCFDPALWIDPKGRLFVPAKLREELGSAFYVAKAPDACLTVYPEAEWQKVLDHCNALPASKARGMRVFFANVVKCEPDKQGRFLLPESFRTYAGITQEAVFLGQAGRAEIWSAERYEAEEQKYLTPEALAAVMEELGF